MGRSDLIFLKAVLGGEFEYSVALSQEAHGCENRDWYGSESANAAGGANANAYASASTNANANTDANANVDAANGSIQDFDASGDTSSDVFMEGYADAAAAGSDLGGVQEESWSLGPEDEEW